MEKHAKGIKKFFTEFKIFITRGNVLDLAVGVIVGGAFTAIVNGLSNFILKPIINWLLVLLIGGDGLEGAITMLSPAYVLAEDGTILRNEMNEKVIDLANSIYIDWGAFISSIINFLLVAFTLFVIVRAMNNVARAREQAKLEITEEVTIKRAIRRIAREEQVTKKQAKGIYEERVKTAKAQQAEKERLAAEKAAEEEAAAKAELEAKAMANTRLLEEIRDLLKNRT
jgi:large conductance mechanosensitive channel